MTNIEDCKMREYFAPPLLVENWVCSFLEWYVYMLKNCNSEAFEELIRHIRFDYERLNGDME